MSSNIEEVVAASNSIPKLPTSAKDICGNCGGLIKVAAMAGSGFCCIDCMKAAGADVSSVGTIMFVTTDEREQILKARNTLGAVLWMTKKKAAKK